MFNRTFVVVSVTFMGLCACSYLPPVSSDGPINCSYSPRGRSFPDDNNRTREERVFSWDKEHVSPLKYYSEDPSSIHSVCKLPDGRLLVVEIEPNEIGADHNFFLLENSESEGVQIWGYFPWETSCEPTSFRSNNIVLTCAGIDLVEMEKLIPLDGGDK